MAEKATCGDGMLLSRAVYDEMSHTWGRASDA